MAYTQVAAQKAIGYLNGSGLSAIGFRVQPHQPQDVTQLMAWLIQEASAVGLALKGFNVDVFTFAALSIHGLPHFMTHSGPAGNALNFNGFLVVADPQIAEELILRI